MEPLNVKVKRATFVQTIILLVLFLGFESTAFAKLHFTAIRGMQEHIQLKPEYEYLDPIAAFNLQRQGFLVNLVNYPIEEESGKLDPISVWIKSIYTAPQNSDSPTFFQVSPLVKNFAWLLGPSAIGHILGKLAISESDKLKFKNKALQNQLKNDLKILIEKDSEFQGNIKSADESAQEYQKQMDKFEFPERKLKEQSLIRNRDQIKALGNQALELKQINKRLVPTSWRLKLSCTK
ncbi:MAG: hypothetical protein ABIQ95_05860 [Bdellovibrionia bacterium]